MDLEGFARILMREKGEKNGILELAELISKIKNVDLGRAKKIAEAVFKEIKNAYSKSLPILEYYRSDVKVGEFGVGCRGYGDYYVHKKISELIEIKSELSPRDMDDAGVVKIGKWYISVSVDGIHSRLSEFPFISGFHVTRAAMRDIYVMGAEPIAVFSDIHIADDGDVSKIFDHVAGILAVCEVTKVPLVAGSTLRIGGDMVIGERMTGAVGCVGLSKFITPRKNVKEGDVILLTEGAGGGTICTTAIYNGYHEIVYETINLDFIKACKAIFKNNLLADIHSMTDVTNGGIRQDANEICRMSGKSLIFEYEKIRELVNKKVLKMLEELNIDFLGVSLDALMIVCPENVSDDIKRVIRKAGVKIDEVGWVETSDKPKPYLIFDGNKVELSQKFRESAYTPIKKLVGEEKPRNFEKMKENIDKAFEAALKKKKMVVKKLLGELEFKTNFEADFSLSEF